jgi:hypothetical protein
VQKTREQGRATKQLESLCKRFEWDAAIIIAQAMVDDPSAGEAARATAAKILELSPEELTRRLRRAKEEARANDDPGAVRSSQRAAEPSSTQRTFGRRAISKRRAVPLEADLS